MNRIKHFVIFLVMGGTMFVNAKAQNVDWLPSNIDVALKHIVPKYQVLAEESNKLYKSMVLFCEENKKQILENSINEELIIESQVRKNFSEVYGAWAQIQHIKFGPISFLKRQERFQYWPDKHNAGSRQLRQLLIMLENGSLATTDIELKKKSVSIQGLPALERLLFSSDETLNRTECELAIKIAHNLQKISQQVDESWRLAPVEFAKEFELAAHAQGTYSSNIEITTNLANALVTQLLLISEYKLGRSLPKKEGGRTYQRHLEAWRSEISLELIESSLLSLFELYTTGFSEQVKLADENLDNKIQQNFLKTIGLSRQFSYPLVEVVLDDKQRIKIVELQRQVNELEALLREEMFQELDFSIRFNSLDGD